MRPRLHPEVEGCAWCGRPATFRVRFLLYVDRIADSGTRYACDLHIADARRRLCVVHVAAVEVPS